MTTPLPGRRSCKRRPNSSTMRNRKHLEKTLLALGGVRIIGPENDAHAALITARGRLFSQEVHMRCGQQECPHRNAAELWASDINKHQLVTGYALSGDTWTPHIWVVDGEKLYETTHRSDRYFGVDLPKTFALLFWIDNYYMVHLANGRPPDFRDKHHPLMSLWDSLSSLPRDEYYRLLVAYRSLCSPSPTVSR